jgi:hypothetical protein
MPFDISDFLWFGLFAFAFVGYVRWIARGPSARTKELVKQALYAKGRKLISVKPKPEFRLGRGSRALLVARAEDAYGNLRKEYFEVDFWADNLTRNPRVREIGSYLSPVRFLSGDDL